MSGSGPVGPIFHGVWQSLHPATVTRYLPRATLSAGAEAVGLAPSGPAASAGRAKASQASAAMALIATDRHNFANRDSFMVGLLSGLRLVADPALDEAERFGIGELRAKGRHLHP